MVLHCSGDGKKRVVFTPTGGELGSHWPSGHADRRNPKSGPGCVRRGIARARKPFWRGSSCRRADDHVVLVENLRDFVSHKGNVGHGGAIFFFRNRESPLNQRRQPRTQALTEFAVSILMGARPFVFVNQKRRRGQPLPSRAKAKFGKRNGVAEGR